VEHDGNGGVSIGAIKMTLLSVQEHDGTRLFCLFRTKRVKVVHNVLHSCLPFHPVPSGQYVPKAIGLVTHPSMPSIRNIYMLDSKFSNILSTMS
jgi:hypothetical protein